MTFAQFANRQGLGEHSSMIDLLDCAIDYYEEHVRPMPADDDCVEDWFDRANAFAVWAVDKAGF